MTGDPDRQQLLELLSHLYHSEHAASQSLLQTVVLLADEAFREEDARFFDKHSLYRHAVTMLRGTCSREDLLRAGADAPECQAVYVLSRSRFSCDTATLMRAMAITRYLPRVPLFVMLSNSASTPLLRAIGVPAARICARDKLMCGFLAANCVTPGAVPLLVNLMSSETNAKEQVKAARRGGAGEAGAWPAVAPAADAHAAGAGGKQSLRVPSAPLAAAAHGSTNGARHRTGDDVADNGADGSLQRQEEGDMMTPLPPPHQQPPPQRSFLSDALLVTAQSLRVIGNQLWTGGGDVGSVAAARGGGSSGGSSALRAATGGSGHLPRPAWHVEYAEGLSQELYELNVPHWLVGCTLHEAVLVIFFSPLARVLVPAAGELRVRAPSTLEDALRVLETHPLLAEEQAPVVLGSSSGGGDDGGGGGSAWRRVPAAGSSGGLHLRCDLSSARRLRSGDVLFVLLGQVAEAPSGHDITQSGLPALVRGWAACTGLPAGAPACKPAATASAAAAAAAAAYQEHLESPSFTWAAGSLYPFGFGSIGRPTATVRPVMPTAFRAAATHGLPSLLPPQVAVALEVAPQGSEPPAPAVGGGTAVVPIQLTGAELRDLPESPPPRPLTPPFEQPQQRAEAQDRFAWPERADPHHFLHHHRHQAHPPHRRGLSFRSSRPISVARGGGEGGAVVESAQALAVAPPAPPSGGGVSGGRLRARASSEDNGGGGGGDAAPRLLLPTWTASEESGGSGGSEMSTGRADEVPPLSQQRGLPTTAAAQRHVAADGAHARPRGPPPPPVSQLAEPPTDVSGHILVISDDQLASLPLFLYPIRQVSDRDVVVLSRRDPWELVRALAELRPPPRQPAPTPRASADGDADGQDAAVSSSQRGLVDNDDDTAGGGDDVGTTPDEAVGDGGSWRCRLDSEGVRPRRRRSHPLQPQPQGGPTTEPAATAVASAAPAAAGRGADATATALPSSVSRRLWLGVGTDAAAPIRGGTMSLASPLEQQQGQQRGGRLFFVRGSALSARDLRRARLAAACRVVIFNLGGRPVDAGGAPGAAGARGGLAGGGDGGSTAMPDLEEEPAPGGGGVGGAESGARDFAVGCVHDAPAVIATVYIESRLARSHPALVAATTTEISSSAAFRLMGPVPDVSATPSSVPAVGRVASRIHGSAAVPRQRSEQLLVESHLSRNASLPLPQQAEQATVPQSQLQQLHRPTGTATSELERAKSARRVIYVPFLSTESSLAAAEPPCRLQPPMLAPAASDAEEERGGAREGAATGSPAAATAAAGEEDGRRHRVRPRVLSPPLPPRMPPPPPHKQQQQQQDAAEGHWRFVLGYKWSSRYAAGRLFPTSFINRLLGQTFYNMQLMKLADAFAQGDQVRLRHVSVPHALLHTQPGCTASGGGGGGAADGGAAAAAPPLEATGDAPLCACRGSSWPRVFSYFVLQQRVVPLGLFRDRRWLAASLPYVHTNPSLGARCRPGDVAFVVVPVTREPRLASARARTRRA